MSRCQAAWAAVWSSALLVTLAGCVTGGARPDTDQATARTWTQASVLLPAAVTRSGRSEWRLMSDLATVLHRNAPRVPVFLEVTTCTGLGSGYALSALRAGYAVVAPESFARGPQRIAACAPSRIAATVRRWRHQEIDYALQRLRELPWIDPDRIVLGGHHEGAQAVAGWFGDEALAGYLVSGLACADSLSLLARPRPASRSALLLLASIRHCALTQLRHADRVVIAADPETDRSGARLAAFHFFTAVAHGELR